MRSKKLKAEVLREAPRTEISDIKLNMNSDYVRDIETLTKKGIAIATKFGGGEEMQRGKYALYKYAAGKLYIEYIEGMVSVTSGAGGLKIKWDDKEIFSVRVQYRKNIDAVWVYDLQGMMDIAEEFNRTAASLPISSKLLRASEK